MTLLPTHDAKDRPDLPAYELGDFCMVPGCGERRERGDGHHVWRRSNQTKSWWVELGDSTLMPNRVGLCERHHRWVTGDIGGHWARIKVTDGYLTYEALGDRLGEVILEFAYDPYSYLPDALQLTVDGEEKPHEEVVGEKHDHGGVAPGEKCPTCKRRVNHPKKDASPQSKVAAFRVPIDDVTEFEELTEAVAMHLAIDTSEKYWKWKVDRVAKALVLQTDKKELAKLFQGRGG